MSAFLLHADGALLLTGKPLIKAADAECLTEAVAVLEAAKRQAEHRGRIAEHQGFAAGEAAGRAAFAEALAALAAAEADHRARQEAEVAGLALAALRHIAGNLADTEITAALARRAARSIAGRGPVAISVAPDMVESVEAALGPNTAALVTGDPALKPTECRLTARDGQIVADLATQLAAIEKRWNDIHGE